MGKKLPYHFAPCGCDFQQGGYGHNKCDGLAFLGSTQAHLVTLIRDIIRKLPGRRKSGIAIVSANFGGIDDIRQIPSDGEIDTFYFTDIIDTRHTFADSWKNFINPCYPRRDFSDRLRGRYFKHQIHRLDVVQDHRWLIWLDSNVRVTDFRFIFDAISKMKKLKRKNRVFLIPHPHRSSIKQEYEFILSEIEHGSEYLRIRYANEMMTEQMEYFSAQGWNLDAPLWCGTVWIVENNKYIAECWNDWWDQNLRYGMMDQLSISVMLDKHGIKPLAADFSLENNAFFEWGTHAKLA